MKAIIVAAGMGRRLGPHTADIPKCMVDVGGKSILARQVDALRAAGVEEINVVRGYLGDRITVPGLRVVEGGALPAPPRRAEPAEPAPHRALPARRGDQLRDPPTSLGERPCLRFFENPAFRENNILASLFYAEPAMAGGFVFSYSDIVYDASVTRALVAAAGDYRLIVDRGWHRAYEGRRDHPVSEGELTLVADGRVRRVGKGLVAPAETVGEFIGLAAFSAAAAARLCAEYAALRAGVGDDGPFGTARTLRTAYLTDLLNHLIAAGEAMTPVYIDGHWREIDTVEDLERVRRELDF